MFAIAGRRRINGLCGEHGYEQEDDDFAQWPDTEGHGMTPSRQPNGRHDERTILHAQSTCASKCARCVIFGCIDRRSTEAAGVCGRPYRLARHQPSAFKPFGAHFGEYLCRNQRGVANQRRTYIAKQMEQRFDQFVFGPALAAGHA